MKNEILGLHHTTAIAGDAQPCSNFYNTRNLQPIKRKSIFIPLD